MPSSPPPPNSSPVAPPNNENLANDHRDSSPGRKLSSRRSPRDRSHSPRSRSRSPRRYRGSRDHHRHRKSSRSSRRHHHSYSRSRSPRRSSSRSRSRSRSYRESGGSNNRRERSGGGWGYDHNRDRDRDREDRDRGGRYYAEFPPDDYPPRNMDDFPPPRGDYPPQSSSRGHPPPYPPYDPYYPPPDAYYRPPNALPPNPRGGGGGRHDNTLPGVSLLVRNISPDITTSDLQVAFGRIGTVRDVYIPRDFHSQQPKGFAFVEFATPEMAREAQAEMDRFCLKGRELEVVFAQERRKTPTEMRGRVVSGGGGGGGGERGAGPGFERSSSFDRYKRGRERDRNGRGPLP